MCLQASSALGFDPPEHVALTGAGDAIAWAGTIPDFGWYHEVYVLFLSGDRALRRAAWNRPAAPPGDVLDRPHDSLWDSPPHRGPPRRRPVRPTRAWGEAPAP